MNECPNKLPRELTVEKQNFILVDFEIAGTEATTHVIVR